jgi:hypothetical protein
VTGTENIYSRPPVMAGLDPGSHPSFRYQGKCKLTLEAIGTLMTNEERLLLTATAKNTFELLVIGMICSLARSLPYSIFIE